MSNYFRIPVEDYISFSDEEKAAFIKCSTGNKIEEFRISRFSGVAYYIAECEGQCNCRMNEYPVYNKREILEILKGEDPIEE